MRQNSFLHKEHITYNKSLQKIIESHRVDEDYKVWIRTMRRK